MEKICVAVRVRPFVSNECPNVTALWNIADNRISLHRVHGTPVSGVSYTFDHVFDESCSNSTVYEQLTKDIIRAAVEGFNGTAFAYGQTSSGKTFTMNGSDTDPGIIRLAVRDVFDQIHMILDREFLVRVSYMEIYNEEINDLLAVENQKLQIHESLERGIFVAGLREEIVNDAEQVLKLLESGEVNRHFGETNMNARSSRSHTIFRMVIESRGKDNSGVTDSDAIRVSVLNLVDLAGSERIAKTGADGVRLKEGKYINKSLMVLGNVINKLSEGAKQRGHIPYRDSKLTRILQPALGGNAKTSIICTVAPEEVHIEETKGTLQFASRAKRITNCVQVNEILTDAALLKRQKLEIEELRRKLQGSHAEVLEQEILKLRNEMLKYELEHEKLEMELEEERKTHKERDQWIREQQMKIDTLSSLVSFSDTDRSSSQRQGSAKESFKEEFSSSNCISQGDLFRTPHDRTGPNSFVVKRSNYARQVDLSPPPDTVSNVADEETWLEMNKGYVADLDSIQMTPARRIQSFPPSETAPVILDDVDKNELDQIKRQLELAMQEKNELERKHTEQVQLNQKMMQEVSELRREAQVIQEIPKRLCQSLVNCKDLYEDVLSAMQSSLDGEASKVKLLSNTLEISGILFSTLETHMSMLMEDHRGVTGNVSILPKHYEMLRDRLYNDLKSLVSKPPPSLENEQALRFLCDCTNKDCALQEELVSCGGDLISGFNAIKERFHCLQKELDESNRLHAVSKERCFTLERDFAVLKEERDSLLQKVSESTKKFSVATDQKENALKDLNAEVQRRKSIEEEIKQFGVVISDRQKSRASSYSDLKAKIEKMTSEYHVYAPKSLR